jgi:hypothetical protein
MKSLIINRVATGYLVTIPEASSTPTELHAFASLSKAMGFVEKWFVPPRPKKAKGKKR